MIRASSVPSSEPQPLSPSSNPLDGDLRSVNYRCEVRPADTALVRNGKGASPNLISSYLAASCAFTDRFNFASEFEDGFLVHVTDDGHDQASVRIDCQSDVVVLLCDDASCSFIEATVQ